MDGVAAVLCTVAKHEQKLESLGPALLRGCNRALASEILYLYQYSLVQISHPPCRRIRCRDVDTRCRVAVSDNCSRHQCTSVATRVLVCAPQCATPRSNDAALGRVTTEKNPFAFQTVCANGETGTLGEGRSSRFTAQQLIDYVGVVM